MSVWTQTNRKEDVMSFCGLVLTYEGIIGFADNKATIKNRMGEDVEDVGRNPQKIIYNTDLIIVTTGTNMVLNDYDEYVKLEDCLKILMEQYSYHKQKINRHNIKWFYNSLTKLLQKSIDASDNHCYKFLIGYKENIYKVNEVVLSQSTQTLSDTRKSNRDYYQYGVIGDEVYCEIFKGIQFEKGYPLGELERVLKEIMAHLIEVNSMTRKYNPVGKPINVEIFQ